MNPVRAYCLDWDEERAVQKLDKIFAGLILVAMTLFWVIMSPAAITSRISEAKPVSVGQSASVATKPAKNPLTSDQKRVKAERDRLGKSIERLKDRRHDTPALSKEEIQSAYTVPAPMPKAGEKLQNLDDIPDLPVFY